MLIIFGDVHKLVCHPCVGVNQISRLWFASSCPNLQLRMQIVENKSMPLTPKLEML